MHLKKITFIITLSIFLLAGCSGESTTEDMYEHMEQAVTLEEDFADQQEPLVELEKKEKELYEEIINLGMDEFERVEELSQEALTAIEGRAEIIEIEKESIELAIEEFRKIKPLIEDIDDEELKEVADKMYTAMENRYNSYISLHDVYSNSLDKDKELYEMLQSEDLEEEELKNHIDTVNSTYDEVLEANETFNSDTDKYNQLKQDFYQKAEIDVEYNE
ncbi:YkyA family protein [Aquibacillus saliphilus]|uniref:YkyA family protein n=1 Tax=Aquibacillus saliphilus TaxID=1909422 RepID=UPI001CF01F8A